MKRLISYFLDRPLIYNAIFISVITVGIFSWPKIGKEEMPEFAMDWITTTINYPGASAEEIEKFIINPIEDEIKGVQGIYEVNSRASASTASVSVNIDSKNFDQATVVKDFKDAVLRVSLPEGVRNLPRFRQFNSSEKAIIDIGVYFSDKEFLDDQARQELQNQVLLLENKLLSSKNISSTTKKGFFTPELLLTPTLSKLEDKQITPYEIINEIKKQHIVAPIGGLREDIEKKFAINNELDTPEEISKTPIRANFSGSIVKYGDLGEVNNTFVNNPSIFKINGHQGIVLNVKKNPSSDILSARESVISELEKIRPYLKKQNIEVVLMDDESQDVRNRLSLILSNGLSGFILIIITLFFALNLKTAFWVSMGIPFSLAFTLIISLISGQTINNMTLAGIIIVLGIVVDDAIIVADNIKEKFEQGFRGKEALYKGVTEVILPIAASVVTTILAFIPLMFFDGYFGLFIKYIPLIVLFMLAGSLLESYFILPGHLASHSKQVKKRNAFIQIENFYKKKMTSILKKRNITLLFSFAVMGTIFFSFSKLSKFMMFPREDVKEVFIKIKTNKEFDRFQTSRAITPFEKMILKNEDVIAVRTTIANSRRGREVKQNQAWLRVEIKDKLARKYDIKTTIKKWEEHLEKEKANKKFIEARVFKSWFGHGSGSPLEVFVRGQNNLERDSVANELKNRMEKIDGIQNVDVEKPLLKKEFQITLDQLQLKKLNITPASVESTIRAATFSERLYSLRDEFQEFDVRLKINMDKNKIRENLENLSVPSNSGSLVRLSKLIKINELTKPSTIERFDYKRTTQVFADLKPDTSLTPLEVGDILEKKILPELTKKYPNISFLLKGEIEESRKGIGNFKWSIYLVIFSIFILLVISFNDIISPFIIISIVPFGLAGACLTLLIHGMNIFGFFSVIGAIGMIGVIVNDAIVMIDKLNASNPSSIEDILNVSASRIRAILMTTVTTVVGILPTAYGLFGHDSMLSEMMLVMGWGLAFATVVTLVLVPTLYLTFHSRKAR